MRVEQLLMILVSYLITICFSLKKETNTKKIRHHRCVEQINKPQTKSSERTAKCHIISLLSLTPSSTSSVSLETIPDATRANKEINITNSLADLLKEPKDFLDILLDFASSVDEKNNNVP